MVIHDVGKEPFYMLSLMPKRVSDYIRYSVKPSYRFHENGGWMVHKDFLGNAVQIATSVGEYTDYSSLPDDLQLEIAFKKSQYTRTLTISDAPRPLTSYYAELHLLPSAPDSVVKAAYKALVNIHHPDKGGDKDKFTKITEAYNKILED